MFCDVSPFWQSIAHLAAAASAAATWPSSHPVLHCAALRCCLLHRHHIFTKSGLVRAVAEVAGFAVGCQPSSHSLLRCAAVCFITIISPNQAW
jgi:hypothetical protein